MGRNKALIEVDGRAMALRVADVLRQAGCEPVVAIGGDAPQLEALGVHVVADRWPGEGPLGAIITALSFGTTHDLGGRPAVVAACDLPWLDVRTVGSLMVEASSCDVALATTDRDQLLCACWMPSALPALRQRFESGERAVHVAIDGLHVLRIPVAAGPLRNVNTPGDLPPG